MWKFDFKFDHIDFNEIKKNDKQKFDIEWAELSSHMLRGNASKLWKNQELIFDPETRYMDGCAQWITDSVAIIVLASSDGFIRYLLFIFSFLFT